MTASIETDILIIGAGPCGLYLALCLAGQGLKVSIVEARKTVSDAARAITYFPVLFPEFQKVGILEEMRASASTGDIGVLAFRRTADQKVIDRIEALPNRPSPLVIPQQEFETILNRRLEDCPDILLFRGCKIESSEAVSNKGDTITVVGTELETQTQRTFTCRYLIGADGSQSCVRKAMGLTYEGIDLPFKLLAADIMYPFEKYQYDEATFMLDPEHFGNIVRIPGANGQHIWRVACGFPSSLSDEEVMALVPEKFDHMFPGPRPLKYEFIRGTPYTARQLCVPTLQRGNILLVGDAAHIANPYSGQLLAAGILDASSLASCLIAILGRNASTDLLIDWSQSRVKVFKEVVDPLSMACLSAIKHPDPESISQRHPFLKAAKAGASAQPPPRIDTDVRQLKNWVPDPKEMVIVDENKNRVNGRAA